MPSLNQVPWHLFLPSDTNSPVLLLGRRTRQIEAILPGRRFEASEAAGPFAAIVRLPGGPAERAGMLEELSKILLPRGHIVWISDRAPPTSAAVSESSLAGDVSGRSRCFLASGRVLWSPHAAWTQPLRGTGKLDLAFGVLRKAFPILRSVGHRLTVTVPAGGEGGGWIFELIEDLKRRGVADISPEGLGRIDRTGSAMAIGQIAAASGQKFALKVALGKQAAREMVKEGRVLDALPRRSGLSGEILAALPRVEASGCFHGTHYRLESWLPGRPASELMYRMRDRAEALEKAVRWITEFHMRTLGPELNAARDAEWARGVVLGVSCRAGREDGRFADQVAAYLEGHLDQHAVPTVQGHGDFWLGNVIREPNSGRITGIIDWNFADEQAPPLDDVLHLLFHRKGFFSVYDPLAHLTTLLQRRYDQRSRKLIIRYLRNLDLAPNVAAPLAVLYWVRYLATREPIMASTRGWYSRSYLRVRKLLGARLGPDLDRLGSWLSGA